MKEYDKFMLGKVFLQFLRFEAPSVTTARDGLGPLLMQILVFLVILQMEEEFLFNKMV